MNLLTIILASTLALVSPESGNAKVASRWQEGRELQIHFIYTGLGEQMFFVFPDGTTMLLDCGAVEEGHHKRPAPVPPSAKGRAGAYVADYIRRVNPAKDPSQVDYLMLSHYHSDHTAGLPQLIESIHFKKAFDRTYPDMDFPCRLADYGKGDLETMTNVYATLQRRDGTVVEKWRVGERDQLRLLHGGTAGFSVFNLCANGLVADERTGEIIDCYQNYPDRQPGFKGQQWINENGLSVGFILRWGAFSFYTAGDFSDRAVMPKDIERFQIEDVLAEHVGSVTVAKLNHHGYRSMFAKLAKALSPQLWVNCTWNRNQLTDDTLAVVTNAPVQATFHTPTRPFAALADRRAYEGDHVVLRVFEVGKACRVERITP